MEDETDDFVLEDKSELGEDDETDEAAVGTLGVLVLVFMVVFGMNGFR